MRIRTHMDNVAHCCDVVALSPGTCACMRLHIRVYTVICIGTVYAYDYVWVDVYMCICLCMQVSAGYVLVRMRVYLCAYMCLKRPLRCWAAK